MRRHDSLRIATGTLGTVLGTEPGEVIAMLERDGADPAAIARLRAAWAGNPWASPPPNGDDDGAA